MKAPTGRPASSIAREGASGPLPPCGGEMERGVKPRSAGPEADETRPPPLADSPPRRGRESRGEPSLSKTRPSGGTADSDDADAPRRGRDERRAAFHLGLDAETRVAWALRLKFWTILERRWRCPMGEIDLIAVRGRTLAFVEVKARDTLEAAVEAVTPKARSRILAAADLFVARNPRWADHDRRFDVVAVLPRRWPRHLPDAFRGDDMDLPRRGRF